MAKRNGASTVAVSQPTFRLSLFRRDSEPSEWAGWRRGQTPRTKRPVVTRARAVTGPQTGPWAAETAPGLKLRLTHNPSPRPGPRPQLRAVPSPARPRFSMARLL